MPKIDYDVSALMVAQLAARIPPGGVIQVGAFTPLALAAALLAKATHAKDGLLYAIGPSGIETTQVFPITVHMLEPMALGQGHEMHNREIVDRMQSRGVPYEPISPAQLDRYANINLTRISRPGRGALALPGAAGLDSLSQMELPLLGYITRHNPEVLVEQAEFVTAPGHLVRGKSRKEFGISAGGGIETVITNLCVLRYLRDRNRFSVVSLHPGVSIEEVVERTGFELAFESKLPVTDLPDDETLRLLDERIDPLGVRRLEFLDAKARRSMILDLLEREAALFQSLGFPA